MFRNGGALWCLCWLIFWSLEALRERWGTNFWWLNTVWATKRAPWGTNPESPYFLDRLGGHVLNMLFLFFGICFQASFFVEFWDSCFMYVCWLHFSTFFEYFFHNNCPHLVLVSFCKRSIRKHVFGKSDGIKFNTFSACFVDLVSSHVFSAIFLDCLCHLGFHLAPFLRNKPFRKSLQKETPPQNTNEENEWLCPCPEAPWQPPSRAHFSNKKQLFEQLFEALFEFIVEKMIWVLFVF